MRHEAGWYTDPTGLYSYRYWDGLRWTGQVNTGGNTRMDPNPLDPEIATTSPAPGTEAPEYPALSAQRAAPPSVQVTQSGGGLSGTSIFFAIVAAIAVAALVFVLLTDSGDDGTKRPETPTSSEQPTDTPEPDPEPDPERDPEPGPEPGPEPDPESSE